MTLYSKLSIPLFLLLSHPMFAQTNTSLMGARSASLGYASACLEDEWNLFNNIAGLASQKHVTAAFAYDMNPSFAGFNRMATIVTIPITWVVAGFGAYRFGDDLYNEQLLSVGIANKSGIASLGVKANYIQYNIEGFGSKGKLTLSFGGIAQLTPHLLVGAHITNINPPKLSENDALPTIATLGVAFRPSDKVFVTTEVEKDLELDVKWKAGFEYLIHKKISARTGYIVDPQTAFAGIGFKLKKFTVDYCVQINTVGLRHQAGVASRFISKTKSR